MARRQMQVPGTERKRIDEFDTAAEAYVDARDARMELTEKEVTAKEALIALMQKHKQEVYRNDTTTPPLIVTLTPGHANVKVVEASSGGDDQGDNKDAA